MSIEETILEIVEKETQINSIQVALQLGVEHQNIVGVLKSLSSSNMLILAQLDEMRYSLTGEGLDSIHNGSPEARVWALLPSDQEKLENTLGKEVAKVGLSKIAKQTKFIKEGKNLRVEKLEGVQFVDSVQQKLKEISESPSLVEQSLIETIGKPVLDDLKKRKLISLGKVVSFNATKGAEFGKQRTKKATDLTLDMLKDSSWKNTEFKSYNFNALGKPVEGGHLHPLLKLRQEYREILLELGFQEMATNRWVESSFWNFDTLFVPQAHPARDMQDTFFIKDPATSSTFPPDYLQRVREVHNKGYHYEFNDSETQKNVLRTHTTAISSRTLYNLAQTGFKPGKYFSIDRVFRNEEMDKTHLCEFHQIEGFVIDYKLSLANMMHVLSEFFGKCGFNDIRFKPAYNPYTEPSMEVFGFHEGLKKWMEVGNSGVFRPEMLEPMGLPKGITVVAWGLSLERPAMIKYGLNNINKLFGHQVELNFIKQNPICRI